jgi:alpha-1,6-mannosyltransferase
MHIVQLANFYGSQSGGIRVALDELARQYSAAGHRVSLVIPDDHDAVAEEQLGSGGAFPARTVVRIKAPLVPGLGGYRMITTRGNVLPALETLAPDVIELSDKTTLARIVAHERLAHVPTALISHERLDLVVRHTFSDWRIVGGAIARLNRMVTDRVDAIVCCSEFAAQEFREHTPLAVPKIVRIPLGVDLDTFRPSRRPDATDSAPVGTPARPLRLVTVVRLSPEKQPGVVVETVRELLARGVTVEHTIFGAGPYRERLEEAAHGLPIRFAGHVTSRAALAAAIDAADVAVSPGPLETFGLGGLEVLACGTPIVVPDSGALQELIDGDYGRVATADDPSAFADAVLTLTTGDRGARRAAARERAEQFSWGRSAAGFLGLYQRLLARDSRAA